MKNIIYLFLCAILFNTSQGVAETIKKNAQMAKEAGGAEATEGPVGNCSGCATCG